MDLGFNHFPSEEFIKRVESSKSIIVWPKPSYKKEQSQRESGCIKGPSLSQITHRSRNGHTKEILLAIERLVTTSSSGVGVGRLDTAGQSVIVFVLVRRNTYIDRY